MARFSCKEREKVQADWARSWGPRGLPVAKGICRNPVALVPSRSVKAVPYSACCSSWHG